MNSLRDRVYPVTRSSNASECDVTFERYCIYYISLSTLVLNSRDRYEKKWQPNFTRLKTRLRISNI